MIEGTPAITITLPDPEAGCPRHLVEDEIRALGNARHAQSAKMREQVEVMAGASFPWDGYCG
jgi:hypothetical protein